MLKKFTSVRFILSMLLLLSVMFAGYSIYYKVKYWGFEISPKTVSDVWTIEAHISFEPTGEPVTVSLTTPGNSNAFKILEEDVVAPGYKVKKVNNETSRMVLTAPAQTAPQDIYYRVMLFDNIDTRGKIKAPQPAAPKMPIMDEQTLTVAKQIIKLGPKPARRRRQQDYPLHQPGAGRPDGSILSADKEDSERHCRRRAQLALHQKNSQPRCTQL